MYFFCTLLHMYIAPLIPIKVNVFETLSYSPSMQRKEEKFDHLKIKLFFRKHGRNNCSNNKKILKSKVWTARNSGFILIIAWFAENLVALVSEATQFGVLRRKRTCCCCFFFPNFSFASYTPHLLQKAKRFSFNVNRFWSVYDELSWWDKQIPENWKKRENLFIFEKRVNYFVLSLVQAILIRPPYLTTIAL